MKVLKVVVTILLLFVFLAMVVLGQKNLSYTGFFIQLGGLAGLLLMLYGYNRKYR